MVPILFRLVCLRDNKEDNEKRRKQDEKRLEIQCMILINQTGMFSFSQKFVKKKVIKNLNYGIFLNIKNYIYHRGSNCTLCSC